MSIKIRRLNAAKAKSKKLSMLVKFFKTKNGGSVAGINYLLQLTNSHKEYENHLLSQEQCQELLENLKKSLEGMH